MRVLLEAAAGSGADVLDYKKKTETKRLPAVTRIRRNSCFCELRRAVRDTSIVPANSTAVSFDDTGTTLVVLIWSVVCVVLSPTFFVLPQMFRLCCSQPAPFFVEQLVFRMFLVFLRQKTGKTGNSSRLPKFNRREGKVSGMLTHSNVGGGGKEKIWN